MQSVSHIGRKTYLTKRNVLQNHKIQINGIEAIKNIEKQKRQLIPDQHKTTVTNAINNNNPKYNLPVITCL